MGFINNILGITTLRNQVKALQSSANLQTFSNISAHIYPSWYVFKDIETYRIMDEISSVVKYLANTAAMIPIYAYNKIDEEDSTDKKIEQILKEFTFEQRYIMFFYLYLCDEVFIYKEYVDFGVNAGVPKIHFLHPNNMTIVLSEGFPTYKTGYIYQDNLRGVRLYLQPDEVIFIKGFNPTIDYQLQWRGQSAISLLCQSLTRLSSGKSGSVAQLQNGGMPGILYEKSAPDGAFDAIERQGLRDTKLAAFLRNQDNKGAPYTAVGDMGWIQMGLPLADLQVAELAKIDKDSIYNAYAVSNRLFNNDATGSEVSDTNARKSLYLNAIAPKMRLVQDALTFGLIEPINTDVYIKFDISDIPELQENMLEKMNALAAAPTMIPNEIREAAGFARIDDPALDKVYIKSGYQPIDDFNNDVLPIDANA